jgi:DNA invertase Pin-like site-specific DNA recombinase
VNEPKDQPLAHCPTCGQKLVRGRVGRPPLTVPVLKVINALSKGLTVAETAKKFGISRASVYRMKQEYEPV